MFKKFLLAAILFFFSISVFAQNPLKLKYYVSGNDLNIILETQGIYNYTFVNSNNPAVTGSGSVSISPNLVFISVPETGTYIVSILPIGAFSFSGQIDSDHRSKFTEITQWGDVTWNTDLSYMFYKWNNLQITATDIPNFSNVTNMSGMFKGCTNLSIVNNINNWNVSNVTDMNNMFSGALAFNKNISNWDVSNVTNMTSLFRQAKVFNQDISNWNVSQVSSMYEMFHMATNFNQNIGGWNVANVTYMSSMFYDASNFNQNIINWNTSNVTDFSNMFQNTYAFNQNISLWNVSNAMDMTKMFYGAYMFDQNLGSWDLSPVVSLVGVFNYSGLSCNNLGATLKVWAENPDTPLGRLIGLDGKTLGTNGQIYKNQLIDNKGWTFTGGTYDPDCAESFLEIEDLSFENNKIVIYPNPAMEKIVIKANQKPSKVQITDALGKTVLRAENVEEIGVAHLSSGLYFVTVTLEDGFISSHKLIKH